MSDEHPIFRNLQFEPKIWGLTYFKFFGTFMILIVSIMIFKSLGILTGVIIGVIVTIATYSYFFWDENLCDNANKMAGLKIKKNITSFEPSNWRDRIK